MKKIKTRLRHILNKKRIIIASTVIVAIVIFGYALKTGIVVINIRKTPFKDPTSGKSITREEFNNKTANDLYKDAVEFNKKGNYGDASDFLNEAIKRDNNDTNISVMHELAVSNYNLKKYDDAIAAYQKIIAVSPDSASVYNEIGNVYRDKGERKTAEDSYKKAIGIDSGYILAYNNLAMMFVQDNDLNAAKKIIQDGLAVNKDSAELQRILKSLEQAN